MLVSRPLHRRVAFVGFALATFWLCQSQRAVAQTVTWLGGSNVSWGTVGNWSSGAVPGSGRLACVSFSFTGLRLAGSHKVSRARTAVKAHLTRQSAQRQQNRWGTGGRKAG